MDQEERHKIEQEIRKEYEEKFNDWVALRLARLELKVDALIQEKRAEHSMDSDNHLATVHQSATQEISLIENHDTESFTNQEPKSQQEQVPHQKPRRLCPKCGGTNIRYTTTTEKEEAGFGMCLLYLILAITVVGILILIPLFLFGNKTKTVTYAVCQDCGTRWKVSEE